MFIVRCNACGKKYDYDEYDYCPRCGHENCFFRKIINRGGKR